MSNTMRFVTDHSKGILGDPDSSVMWTDIISHIPDEVLLRPGVRILNVACGHGTEADIIFRRMVSLGVSREQALSSITLLDRYYVFTNRASRRGYKNVIRADFLTWNTDMKFDIVLGNPPFQADSLGRAEKLWPKFIDLAHKLCEDGGISILVTPTSWMSGSGNIIKGSRGVYHDIFKANQLTYVNLDVAKHFDVSSTFCYYLLEKRCHESPTQFVTSTGEYYIDLNVVDFIPPKLTTESISINTKTLGCVNKFGVVSFTAGDKHRKHGVDAPTVEKNIKTYIRGNNSGKVHFAYFADEQNSKVSKQRKIIIPLSGAEKFMPYVDDVGIPHCTSSYVIPLNDGDTLKGAMSVFNSNLFKYLMQENRTSGFVQVFVVKNLPVVDLSRSWTDAELYAHFNLTEEEIALIESTVK